VRKLCTVCLQTKALKEFAKDRCTKSGYGTRCKECNRLHSLKWRKENPTKARESGRLYRARNPDQPKNQIKNWVSNNRQRVNDYHLARRAKKRNQWVEDVDRQVVFERDHGICGICKDAVDPDNWQLDHIVPIAMSGVHSYENTQVSHPFCNRSKGGRV
jgi:5-methylcytosine-specific restriction endonuclease McrA